MWAKFEACWAMLPPIFAFGETPFDFSSSFRSPPSKNMFWRNTLTVRHPFDASGTLGPSGDPFLFTLHVQASPPMSTDQSPVRQSPVRQSPVGQSPVGQSVFVNGDATAVAQNCTVNGLLETLGLAGRRVAVAVNGEVVPRSHHAGAILAADDRVEILEAVGGG